MLLPHILTRIPISIKPTYLPLSLRAFGRPLYYMSTAPLLPVTRQTQAASLSLSRTPPPPSRIRIGRLSPTSFESRRYSSPPPSPTASEQGSTSLGGRLKQLIKAYGWYALGMYIVIGFVDFGIAFGMVHFIGAETVSRWVVEGKAAVISIIHPDRDAPGHSEIDLPEHHHAASQGGREGLIAMVVLAYAVHKTLFLPFRVGLVAAITPKFVNWLTRRGWAGRAGTIRAASHVREKMRRGKERMED